MSNKLTRAEKKMIKRLARRYRREAAQLRKLAQEQERLAKRLGMR